MTPDTITPRDPEIWHDQNDTRHWSPARVAALTKQQRIDELTADIADCEANYSQAEFETGNAAAYVGWLYDELNRVSAMPPLEYAAELDAAQATADADSLAAEVAGWADTSDDYKAHYEVTTDGLEKRLSDAGFGSAGPM